MTQEQTELINIIKETNNPAKAIAMAIEIITDFLQRHESCREPSVDSPRERD